MRAIYNGSLPKLAGLSQPKVTANKAYKIIKERFILGYLFYYFIDDRNEERSLLVKRFDVIKNTNLSKYILL